MVARVRAERIPGDLGIVMRMVVDNSWGDHQAVRIHDSMRSAVHSSNLDDPAAADSDVAVKARQPRTVDYFAVLDDQVVAHCSSVAGRSADLNHRFVEQTMR